MKRSSTNRILGADTIRALAALWVFACHLFVMEPRLKTWDMPGLNTLSVGFMGVAAFFVLSGFLLSLPFWRAYRAGSRSPGLKAYAMRRLARIVPEYYLCMLLCVAVTGAFTSWWELIQVVGCLTFTNTFLPKTYMPEWNPPLWSISIEMSFYCMLPLVMLSVSRLRSITGARLGVMGLMILIALLQPALLHVAPTIESAIGNGDVFSVGSDATTKNVIVMFAHFLVGVIAADVHLSRPVRPVSSRFNRFDLVVIAVAVLMGCLLEGVLYIPWPDYMHYQWPIFPALIGIWLICLPRTALIGRLVEGRFIRITATLSYGFYLWHVPILYMLKRVWPATAEGGIQLLPVYILAALACSYIAAAISYYCVGKPTLDWIRRQESKQVGS